MCVLVSRVGYPETQVWGFGSSMHGEMGLRQVEQGFYSFFAKFLTYLMIFQSSAAPSECPTLKNHQIWQKMKKSLVQLATHISTAALPTTRSFPGILN